MNIATLEQYVDQKNRWGAIFGEKPRSLLSAIDRQYIAGCLESDLSPENLTCDGELSRREVTAKYKFLRRVAEELESIDPTITVEEY